MSKTKEYHMFMVIGLWAAVHGFLFWHFGIRTLYDSRGYLSAAQFLKAHGVFEDAHLVFYAVPIFLIALSGQFFSNQILCFLILQSIISGLATLALYHAGARVFKSLQAGLLSCIIFLLWWDNIQWNTAVMSESLLCSFTCFILYFLTRFNGSLRHHLCVMCLLVILFFTRPTGIVIILGVVAFLVHFHWPVLQKKPMVKVAILSALGVVGYVSATMMLDQWDFTDQYKRGNIVTYMDTIQGSQLYDKSLRMDIEGVDFGGENGTLLKIIYFIWHNPLHFLKSASLKVWYLLSGMRPYYSLMHNVVVLSWMIGVYVLCLRGWLFLQPVPLKTIFITIVVVNCALIAISTVDWDNRFYIPMEPVIVLFAGGGFRKFG